MPTPTASVVLTDFAQPSRIIRLMSKRLPVQIDPVTLADRGRWLHGELPVEAFHRLASALYSRKGWISAELRFGQDSGGRRHLSGSLTGGLELECQRCLAPYRFPVDIELSLVLVETESEAEALPEGLDPLVVGERRSVHTVDMLEDDLILALPIIPRCESEDQCQPAVQLLDSEAIEASGGPERQTPFAGLGGERH